MDAHALYSSVNSTLHYFFAQMHFLAVFGIFYFFARQTHLSGQWLVVVLRYLGTVASGGIRGQYCAVGAALAACMLLHH